MNQLFLSILVIGCGGILPLFLWRQFALMKAVGVLAIGGGCLLGLVDAWAKLTSPVNDAVSFSYLGNFSLSFSVDTLSAFFLIVIFGVSLLAAIYSFHYMSNAQKALRTAAHYLFFSLLVAVHGAGGNRRQPDHLHSGLGDHVALLLFPGGL
jgi:hydrogenase-4 component B